MKLKGIGLTITGLHTDISFENFRNFEKLLSLAFKVIWIDKNIFKVGDKVTNIASIDVILSFRKVSGFYFKQNKHYK